MKRRGFFILNKKAVSLITPAIMMILLTVFFSLFWFYHINSKGTGDHLDEQKYAKQIALVIDSAKPDTKITINIPELYHHMEKNKLKGNPLNIDVNENKVLVKVTTGKGYSYYYFSDLKFKSTLSQENKNLVLEFEECLSC